MLNIVEFFSGIGSQAKALKNLGLDINTVGTSEWDVHAIIAYDLIHNNPDIPQDILDMNKEELLDILKKYTFSNTGKAPLEYDSLKTYSLITLQRLYLAVRRNRNYVDISEINGADLPGNIDILTYSFPCQDLSNVGAFHGYNKGIDKDSGSRSSLLWQVGRILSEMKEADISLPKFLLMENVPSLLYDRHFSNFSVWINDLKNLGYVSKYYQLNASSFGLPQNRPRLLMISVYVGDDVEKNDLVLDYFRAKSEQQVVDDYVSSPHFHQYTVKDLLRINYTNQKIFEEAVECTPNDTVSRKKIWDENPQIILPGYIYNDAIDVVRTITTKQDRNPNSGNLYFDSNIPGKSKFRYLTPRECLLFMGFTDADYRSLKNNNIEFHKGDALFARDKVIRMAGNSIPVKLLEGIFLQIIQIADILNEYSKHKPTEGYDAESYKIRSYLFSKGIRNRVSSGEYPLQADIVYPKYRTALYIQDCFWHRHDCIDAELPQTNYNFWEEQIRTVTKQDEVLFSEATSMGWNAIPVYTCMLKNENASDFLKKLEITIRDNLGNKNEEGRVIQLG